MVPMPIGLKIGSHIDCTVPILCDPMYHTKNCTNKNNITLISMAIKYPIIKHRVFFKNLAAEYHPFILDGLL